MNESTTTQSNPGISGDQPAPPPPPSTPPQTSSSQPAKSQFEPLFKVEVPDEKVEKAIANDACIARLKRQILDHKAKQEMRKLDIERQIKEIYAKTKPFEEQIKKIVAEREKLIREIMKIRNVKMDEIKQLRTKIARIRSSALGMQRSKAYRRTEIIDLERRITRRKKAIRNELKQQEAAKLVKAFRRQWGLTNMD